MRLGQVMQPTRKQFELYGSASCPYTRELREHLEWRGESFVEYDVDADACALERLFRLTPGQPAVPVLVENGAVSTVGWRGRFCVVDSRAVRNGQ
jgi:glutaredoxin